MSGLRRIAEALGFGGFNRQRQLENLEERQSNPTPEERVVVRPDKVVKKKKKKKVVSQ
jgi:hypothetical protein